MMFRIKPVTNLWRGSTSTQKIIFKQARLSSCALFRESTKFKSIRFSGSNNTCQLTYFKKNIRRTCLAYVSNNKYGISSDFTAQTPHAQFRKNARFIHTSSHLLKNDYRDDSLSYGSSYDDPDEHDDESDSLSEVLDHSNMYNDQYLYPSTGHRIFIIHPDSKRSKHTGGGQMSAEHHVAEACGLIDALPGWSVVRQEIIGVRQLTTSHLFTKGVSAEVKVMVRECRNKTAVLVNMSMLTGLQLATLQDMWGVPVYDRYTIILQIFRLRAHTREVKLQLALAEIPYYRSRLRGMHQGSLGEQQGGLHHVGGSGRTWIQTRFLIMSEKEQVIKKKLAELKNKRHLLRQERKKKEIPMVAVVGYTNAGKTSLIKALTKSVTMEPWDQVFATLDVTCHAGYLGNHMKVVYVDTVGFISEIPTSLIESFAATLEDASNADVIVHVRDASHPDTQAQKETVIQTLLNLKLPPQLMETIIEVNNKVDLLPGPAPVMPSGAHQISVVTGEGIPQLIQSLEDAVITNTGRVDKWMKIPQAGPHLTWLYREGTVIESIPCESDSESLLVHVIMTGPAYSKFCARFKGNRQK